LERIKGIRRREEEYRRKKNRKEQKKNAEYILLKLVSKTQEV